MAKSSKSMSPRPPSGKATNPSQWPKTSAGDGYAAKRPGSVKSPHSPLVIQPRPGSAGDGVSPSHNGPKP